MLLCRAARATVLGFVVVAVCCICTGSGDIERPIQPVGSGSTTGKSKPLNSVHRCFCEVRVCFVEFT